jgi:predicted RNase H-like HicB family nuclease
MSTVLYAATAFDDPAGGYAATFPDLPGCEARGADTAQLLANARTAVAAHLQGLADQGDEWPPATPLHQLQPQPGAVVLLVDVPVDDPPVRVNISIGEQLLKRLDAAAEARGATRSGFIAEAIRASLGASRGRVGAAVDLDATARQIQDELSAVGRRINASLGPDSAFSRSMAEFDDRVLDTVRRAADGVSAAIVRRRAAEARPADPPASGDDHPASVGEPAAAPT